MNINLSDAIPSIIGQRASQTLATIRAPHFLPEGLLQHRTVLWIVLLMAGLVGLYLARQRSQRRVQLVIACLLAATLGWAILANVFITPAQRLEAVHRHILNAAQAKDVPAVMSNLSDDFHWGPLPKALMPAMVGKALDTVSVKAFYLTGYQADVEGDLAQTRFVVTVYTEGGQTPTGWQLRWQDDPQSDWKLVAVEKWRVADIEMPPGLPAEPMMPPR